MCEFHDSNGNGFGDIWWTDKHFYLSNIIDEEMLEQMAFFAGLMSIQDKRAFCLLSSLVLSSSTSLAELTSLATSDWI